ncbi:F-box protein CPR1-like [Gastrolobium bilobum]|uniref:F-box protein CPR1-like n=1 Tax=Gastrolobium bilobum TaxID=150636 RepID=UPI002AB19F7E|nr:F-box protein CPR1-like [Gastrolobium bilobum]
MVDLPPEVITEIIFRLPVSSLLRFRSTCKWWRSLIDATHFIFSHLNKSIESNSNIKIIIRKHSDLYQIELDSLEKVVELNHPLMCYSNRIKVLGSCNGLLCLCNIAEDIVMWNPSIRKHRILPAVRLNRGEETSLFAARVYGLGYDSLTGDYKLVRISYFVDLHNRTFDSQVMLFSLRMDCWKTLPSMPYALCCARTMGVFVGGALHWVVTRKLEPDQPDLVVAFDLRGESFREVPLPVAVKGSFEMEVALFGGCLCVIENRVSTLFDVWVMTVYGSQDSWCKLFTVKLPSDLRPIKSVKPLAYSRNGDKVLLEQDRCKLSWYNLKREDLSHVEIPGMPKKIEATVYVGSLVPPALLSQTDGSKHQKLGDEKTRKRRDDFLSQGFKLTL